MNCNFFKFKTNVINLYSYITRTQNLFLFCSLPPQEIQIKMTDVVLNAVSSLSLVLSLCLTNGRKEATKVLLSVPPPILFFSFAPESESAKVAQQKPTRCSLLSVQQLNYRNNTDQERFSVVRRYFTVRYENP